MLKAIICVSRGFPFIFRFDCKTTALLITIQFLKIWNINKDVAGIKVNRKNSIYFLRTVILKSAEFVIPQNEHQNFDTEIFFIVIVLVKKKI